MTMTFSRVANIIIIIIQIIDNGYYVAIITYIQTIRCVANKIRLL